MASDDEHTLEDIQLFQTVEERDAGNLPCAKCKQRPRVGETSTYCRPCRATYMRDYRADLKAAKPRKARKSRTWAGILEAYDKRLGVR